MFSERRFNWLGACLLYKARHNLFSLLTYTYVLRLLFNYDRLGRGKLSSTFRLPPVLPKVGHLSCKNFVIMKSGIRYGTEEFLSSITYS